MSRILSCGLLLVVPACLTSDPATQRVDQGLIGGQIAMPSEFPSVVALENRPGEWFCTGTLIDKDWVLTAAHCVEGETAAGMNIRFDDANVNDTTGGKVVKVAAIHGHPGYDGIAWDNDIALIKLASSVTDRDPTPVHRPVVAAATAIVDVGYGDADDNGGGAGLLRKMTNKTIDCATIGDPTVSGANILCFDPTHGKSSCYGDSGGPAFVELPGAITGKLAVAGITSGGTEESCTAGWDLYTSVAGELAFIDEIMGTGPGTNPDPGGSGDGGGDGKADDDGGCNAGGGSSGLWLVAGLLVLVRRRRR